MRCRRSGSGTSTCRSRPSASGGRCARRRAREGDMYTMRPQAFEYHRPETLDEALSLLADVEDSRALAGGHSLLPMMKLRLATPAALVDLGRLPGLAEIRRDGDDVTIRALATHA